MSAHYIINPIPVSSGGGYSVQFIGSDGVECGGARFPLSVVGTVDDVYMDAYNCGESWLSSLHVPLEPVKRGRGRPRIHASAADRQAAYVARKGVAISVVLPPDVADALDAYMVRHRADGSSRSDVLAKLISSQLLRKR